VDIDAQPNYPYSFHQGDALLVLSLLIAGHGIRFGAEEVYLSDFAAVHASPPCQSFLNLGKVNLALGRSYDYPNLIGPVRELLVATGKPYVIENVQDASSHLMNPVRVCGTGLGPPIRRHRLFESNVPTEGIPCAHGRFTEQRYWTSWRPNGEKRMSTVVQVYGNAGGQHEWPEAMGIDWMDRHGFVEAVPPAYTAHIGAQLLGHVRQGVSA
jgi:DNA (cytosine-5)-methyltransferase 1